MIATLKNLHCVEIFSCWRWIDSLLVQLRTELIAPDSLLTNVIVSIVWDIYYLMGHRVQSNAEVHRHGIFALCCTTTKLTTREGSPERPIDGTWETTGRTFYHTSEPIRVFAATFSRLKAQSFPQLSPFLFARLPLVVLRAAWSCCLFFFCRCICGGCSWLWSPCQLRWLQTFSLEGCHEESALFLCRDLNKIFTKYQNT